MLLYIYVNDTNIEMVYVNKFVGVLIDHKLKGKQHIKMITSKLSKTISIMNRTNYILDKKYWFDTVLFVVLYVILL